MREIKFRAWSKGDKRMVEFDLEDLMFGTHSLETVDLKYWTVLQYTGLKDKNNNEIYEGDVIKTSLGNRSTLAVIKWEQPTVRNDYEGQYSDLNGYVQFGGWTQKGNLPLAMHEGNYEVIGNIYENPELIEIS